MLEIITGSLISFLITLFLLPVLIRFAYNRKLFVVRHYRNVHSDNISSLGGIAVFVAVLFVMLFFSETSFREIKYYLAGGSFIFLVGLRDDLQNVRPPGKLIGQFIAAFLIVVPAGMRIDNHGSLLEMFHFSEVLSVLFTIAVIVWIINAYNFFDGIDIQAALFALLIFIPSGFWFYFAAQYNFALLLFATSTSLAAFLYYNKTPSKIFMGDTGTVTIGFIMAFAFIKFVRLNAEGVGEMHIHNAFLFGLMLLQLPLLDSVRVVLTRILRIKSPFEADKNHFHHLLLRLGMSHARIAFISTGYTLIIMVLNYYLFAGNYSVKAIIGINMLLSGLLYGTIYYLLSRKK